MVDLAKVLAAVVDLPVDFSAGFLALSGCFLSSVLALDFSAESPLLRKKKKQPRFQKKIHL